MPLFDVAPHGDLNKGINLQANCVGVQHSAVTSNDAGFFQCPHPAQTRRSRQKYFVGQIGIIDASIFLQVVQNRQIGLIKFHIEYTPR